MSRRFHMHLASGDYNDEEEEDDDCVEMNSKGVKFSSVGSKESSGMPSKKPKQKGPMDMFFTPIATNVVKGKKAVSYTHLTLPTNREV